MACFVAFFPFFCRGILYDAMVVIGRWMDGGVVGLDG